jgi:hypothetical protein
MKLGMVVYTCSLGTQVVEAEGLPVPDQRSLHNETLSQKNK